MTKRILHQPYPVYKTKRRTQKAEVGNGLALAFVLLFIRAVLGAEFGISAIDPNGVISWTNAFPVGVLTLETKPVVTWPWTPQPNIFTTNAAGSMTFAASPSNLFCRLLAVDISSNSPDQFPAPDALSLLLKRGEGLSQSLQQLLPLCLGGFPTAAEAQHAVRRGHGVAHRGQHMGRFFASARACRAGRSGIAELVQPHDPALAATGFGHQGRNGVPEPVRPGANNFHSGPFRQQSLFPTVAARLSASPVRGLPATLPGFPGLPSWKALRAHSPFRPGGPLLVCRRAARDAGARPRAL